MQPVGHWSSSAKLGIPVRFPISVIAYLHDHLSDASGRRSRRKLPALSGNIFTESPLLLLPCSCRLDKSRTRGRRCILPYVASDISSIYVAPWRSRAFPSGEAPEAPRQGRKASVTTDGLTNAAERLRRCKPCVRSPSRRKTGLQRCFMGVFHSFRRNRGLQRCKSRVRSPFRRSRGFQRYNF